MSARDPITWCVAAGVVAVLVFLREPAWALVGLALCLWLLREDMPRPAGMSVPNALATIVAVGGGAAMTLVALLLIGIVSVLIGAFLPPVLFLGGIVALLAPGLVAVALFAAAAPDLGSLDPETGVPVRAILWAGILGALWPYHVLGGFFLLEVR